MHSSLNLLQPMHYFLHMQLYNMFAGSIAHVIFMQIYLSYIDNMLL